MDSMPQILDRISPIVREFQEKHVADLHNRTNGKEGILTKADLTNFRDELNRAAENVQAVRDAIIW